MIGKGFRKSKVLSSIVIAAMIFSNVMVPSVSASATQKNQQFVVGQASSAFTDYINNAKAKIKKAVNDNKKNEHIPMPVQFKKAAASVSSSKTVNTSSLPAKYDLRTLNRVTSVKNQGQIGSCWAFGTYGSLESWMLTSGSGQYDFSENNMITHSGFDISPDNGGNALMSAAYLARWDGPVNETDDPYANPATASNVITRNNVPVQEHVQDVVFIPQRANALDNDDTKNSLIKYGALYTAISYDDKYYNTADYAFFNYDKPSNSLQTNHAVTIVGWDDTYSRNNFKVKPAGDGAYIVKNSWGTSWGDKGYFYVSYYDNFLGSETAAFIDAQSTKNYDNIYQYDPLGFIDKIGYNNNTAWFSNVFNASGSQQLKAVSFYTTQKASQYEAYVETNYTANKFTKLTKVASGSLDMPGYHTIQLPSSIALAANNSFAVAVKLIAPNETMPIAIEDYEPNYSSKATASVGQSFVSPDGKNWTDLMQSQPSLKANVCLKAFTSNSTVTPAVVSSAPVNGAVNVSNTTPITVTFNTAVQKGINFSAISVKDSTGKSVTISSTIKESVPAAKCEFSSWNKVYCNYTPKICG